MPITRSDHEPGRSRADPSPHEISLSRPISEVVTEPGRAGHGPTEGDADAVTWAGSLGIAGRGALASDPERRVGSAPRAVNLNPAAACACM
jgi:hypothetical protein